MANSNNKQTTKQPIKQKEAHHYIRTLFASLFGFFAVSLIITSILVVWLGRTLTNTDQYVKTVGPLVTKPEVQDFVVTSISDALLENDEAPIRDIATQILGNEKIVGQIDEQLKIAVRPIVEENLRSVVASDEFTKLWADSNRSIHSQLITQLKSDSQDFTLNFHPLIVGVVDQLGATKLSFVKDKLEIKEDMGVIKLEAKKLDEARQVYDYFQKAMIAIIGCAILSLALCILISVHHLKTLRRVALSVGIFAGILALSLSATSLVKPSGASAEQQEVAVAVINAVTQQLRLTLIIVAVICIGGTIGSKVYALLMSRKSHMNVPK